MARYGGGSALHHDQPTSDIGDMRGLDWRCAARKTERVSGKNRVSRPGHIDRLIAAVHGDVNRSLAALKDGHAIFPARDDKGSEFHLV